MGRPQDSGLQRSGNTPLDPDHLETEVSTHPHAPFDEPGGGAPVPPDNQPGHHPDHEQDKPDLARFAERLGVPPEHHEDHEDHEDHKSHEDHEDHEAEHHGDPQNGLPRDEVAESSSEQTLGHAVVRTTRHVLVKVTQVSRAGLRNTVHIIERRAPVLGPRSRMQDRIAQLEQEVSDLRARVEDQR